jgi:hypothetical protein
LLTCCLAKVVGRGVCHGFGSSHDRFGRGLGAPAAGGETGSSFHDMGVRKRRHAIPSGGAELVDDAGDVDSVPHQHGVGEQAEVFDLALSG